jgi:di/tricarboxylate transporter
VLLRAGDVLLVQGPRDRIDELKTLGSLLVLDERVNLPASRRGKLAIVITIAVVAAAALGLLPIAISATLGALLMLLTRCMTWRDVQGALSVPVILIVVVSLALGSALQQTQATQYVAEVFLFAMTDAAPATILAGLILLMAILTNVVSNNAAAVIGTPIAISMANQLGVPAEPFVLAVLFGANLSFSTPMAYKTNVLVMSAGSYSFADFARVGLPLTVLLWAAYSWLLPRLYDI